MGKKKGALNEIYNLQALDSPISPTPEKQNSS